MRSEPLPQARVEQLARTLDRIATQGAREFYEGETAWRLAAGLKQVGSPLTAQDMARCRARDENR